MENVGKIVAWTGGAIFVGAYITLLVLQFCHVGADDAEWIRRMELLNPLQSLAFAGAGVLLGTAVQQQATRSAQQQADANAEDAEKGRALDAAVKAKVAAPGATPQEVQDLARLAEQIS